MTFCPVSDIASVKDGMATRQIWPRCVQAFCEYENELAHGIVIHCISGQGLARVGNFENPPPRIFFEPLAVVKLQRAQRKAGGEAQSPEDVAPALITASAITAG